MKKGMMTRRKTVEEWLYYFALCVLSVISAYYLWVIARPVLETLHQVPVGIWKIFSIAMLGYGIFCILAYLYSRVFDSFSWIFWFVFFLFGMFFFEQIYMSFDLHRWIPELWYLWGLLLSAFFLAGFQAKKKKVKLPGPFQMRLSAIKFGWSEVLITVWILVAFLYFFSANFSGDRAPVMDEFSFWHTQASDYILIDESARVYGRHGSNAYAIPFITALPQMLFKSQSVQGLYFMPVIIVGIIAGCLNGLKKNRWAFVFFLGVLLLTVNRHLWWRQLIFSLLYGEGISSAFVLVILYEFWRWKDSCSKSFYEVFVLAFGIGLIFYTKPPSSYVFFAFLPLLFLKRSIPMGLKWISLPLSVLPYIFWRIDLKITLNSEVSQILDVSFASFIPMMKYLLGSYTSPVFFACVSFVCIFLTFRKKELVFLIPIAAQLVFIFWGYLTVFKNIEFESSGRYIIHSALGLFFLGSIGFSRVTKKILIPVLDRLRFCR